LGLSFGQPDLDPVAWLGLAQLLAAGGLVAWTLGLLAVWHTLTRPPRRTTAWAIARGLPSDPGELDEARFGLGAIEFTTRRVRLAGCSCAVWQVAGRSPAGPVAVLTHGWGDGKVNALSRLAPFVDACSAVIVWDLPGHGESAGTCRLGLDEHEALGELVATINQPVVFMGWSLGAGVSLVAARARLAKGLGVAGVICEAPYRVPQSPAARVLAARGVPNLGVLAVTQWLIGGFAWRREGGPFDRAEQARLLAEAGVPVLVLHGEADPVSPVEDGRAIAAAARTSAVIVAGGRHNDLWVTPELRGASLAAVRGALAAWAKPVDPGPTAADPAR
jgi:pimeloyl-ACP methyl ester carboxylesterase